MRLEPLYREDGDKEKGESASTELCTSTAWWDLPTAKHRGAARTGSARHSDRIHERHSDRLRKRLGQNAQETRTGSARDSESIQDAEGQGTALFRVSRGPGAALSARPHGIVRVATRRDQSARACRAVTRTHRQPAPCATRKPAPRHQPATRRSIVL